MTLPNWFAELWRWLVSLPPDFAFLLSLPFVVAGTAVLAGLARGRRMATGGAPSQAKEGRDSHRALTSS